MNWTWERFVQKWFIKCYQKNKKNVARNCVWSFCVCYTHGDIYHNRQYHWTTWMLTWCTHQTCPNEVNKTGAEVPMHLAQADCTPKANFKLVATFLPWVTCHQKEQRLDRVHSLTYSMNWHLFLVTENTPQYHTLILSYKLIHESAYVYFLWRSVSVFVMAVDILMSYNNTVHPCRLKTKTTVYISVCVAWTVPCSILQWNGFSWYSALSRHCNMIMCANLLGLFKCLVLNKAYC